MEILIIVKSEKEFEFMKDVQNCRSCLGGYFKDIIREYIVKDLTEKEAFKLWHDEDKITAAEYNYVRKLRGA